MGTLLYILFIKLLQPVAKIISPFNQKAALWVNGRKNIFRKIESSITNDASKKIWMHCASLGEFEQGLPLLEKLKETYPDYKFVLTFFSSSGYEVQKNNQYADYIFYLPADSKRNAEKFIELIQPELTIFIKYEYWYYYLREIHKRNIPILLASGNFLPHFAFFKWYGNIFRKMLEYFTHLFVQNENAAVLLRSINVRNVSISGDTRFDRVLKVSSERRRYPDVEHFIINNKVVVAGSTWLKDDKTLCPFANSNINLRFIIAPHDVSPERLKECRKLYTHSLLYSEYSNFITTNATMDSNINTIIIDNVGMLKFLYRYATICYVGGGFDKGIHNILEAAVYYKPVLFGPKFNNFFEALELINIGGAFYVKEACEIEQKFNNLLSNGDLYNATCRTCGTYVMNNAGATSTIMSYIQDNIFN